MKKSRVLMCAGAFLLAITGMFASKANKKFTAVSNLFYYNAGYVNVASAMGGTIITESSGTGLTKAKIADKSGGSYTLYYDQSGDVAYVPF